jgi:hypothetical protein
VNPAAVRKPITVENAGGMSRPQIDKGTKAIRCNIQSQSIVSLRIFNPSGKRIGTFVSGKTLDRGQYSFALPEKGLARGTYVLESVVNGIKTFQTIVTVK